MRRLVVCLLLGFVATAAYAAKPDDTIDHPSCKACGMDRTLFIYSRMLIEYDDGKVVPTCSLHCAALNLAGSLSHSPTAIKVADYEDHELIDAQSAVWVIGGDHPGVMSIRGKWAFSDRAKAERFIAQTGGSLATFVDAVKATYADMYQDTLTFREKRKGSPTNKP